MCLLAITSSSSNQEEEGEKKMYSWNESGSTSSADGSHVIHRTAFCLVIGEKML